ncbi:MAG TPA: hypothetical protein VMA13_03120 [Candidatus Saccharimonadales bacterium]|nr:hypothetical protein [Candidatus Saccharimonadales bacterium]
MKIPRKFAGLWLVCVVMSAFSLRAQPSAATASQQQQNFQQGMELRQPLLSLRPGTNAPEIYPGENADIGPQYILRLNPQRTYFMVRVDSQYLYSENVLLEQHNPTPGTEFVNTIQAALAPTAYEFGPGRFSPQVGCLSQWFNYEMGNHDLGAADFNVQTVYASAQYRLPNDWTFFGEFDYNRFLSQANYDEFYHEFVPSAGVQRLFQITDKSLLAVSVLGDYHASWTINPPNDSQDRADGIFLASFVWQMTPRIAVQPYYQFQYTYYHRNQPGDNNAYLNSFGLSASYFFTPHLSLRLFASDAINNTDYTSMVQKYHAYNFGADLAYTFRF